MHILPDSESGFQIVDCVTDLLTITPFFSSLFHNPDTRVLLIHSYLFFLVQRM